ncbi:MAG: hypothetical protein IPG00_06135 [Saprospiraceae bacterium]|nr:hypothetical protein [Saprospiraceae bacterium]
MWYKVITDNDNINGESLLISVMPSKILMFHYMYIQEIVSHLFWKDVVTVVWKETKNMYSYLSQWPSTPQSWIQKQSAILHQTHAMVIGESSPQFILCINYM